MPFACVTEIMVNELINKISKTDFNLVGQLVSSEEPPRPTYAITPTFNSTGNFNVGATAFSGIVTVTPGKSGWLSEPPLDVMVKAGEAFRRHTTAYVEHSVTSA